MLKGNGTRITMTEGDYGLPMPITISGGEIKTGDLLKFTIKQNEDESIIFEKTFNEVKNNTFDFVLNETESNKLPVGVYLYSLDWYRENVFLCNLIPKGSFEVEDKV